MKEAEEDPFLEGWERASERGGHSREGEAAWAKLKKQGSEEGGQGTWREPR